MSGYKYDSLKHAEDADDHGEFFCAVFLPPPLTRGIKYLVAGWDLVIFVRSRAGWIRVIRYLIFPPSLPH